jgi:hypothetical protein
MNFLTPLMLVGLAGVLVPVAIHLIGRRRARVVRFAALEFLMSSRRKTARRLQLRERLLFVIRALVCLAIPLALAKPVTSCATKGPLVARGPQAVVVVIDDSFSSSYKLGDRSLLRREIDEAMRILAQLGPEAEIAVIRASEAAENNAELSRDHLRIHDQLTGIEASARPADLTRALARAAQLLSGSSYARRTVYLLSPVAANALRGEPPWGPDGPALEIFDVRGGQPLPNRAITHASVEADPSTGSRGIQVTAEIANFGRESVAGLGVSLRVAGRVVATGTVDIAPGQRQIKRFLATLPPGKRAVDLSVELDGDPLPVDDRRWLHTEVRDEVRVLMVDGDPRTTRHDDELFYLEAALRPGDRADTGTAVTTITVDDLAVVELDDYDVIVLANVHALPSEQVEPLDRWVRGGGGLFITLGDQVDADEYRAAMRSLLPQELTDPVDTTYGAAPDELASRALHLTKWEADHPIFAPFSKDAPGLRDASFTKVFLLGPTTDTADRKVLARFTNGAAALVEASHGDGRLLLYTSTIDRDWNDLAIHTGFLPLAQQAVRHLARKQQRRGGDETLVGRGVSLPTLEERRIEIRPPSGHATVFEGERIEGRSLVRFLGTHRAGMYRVIGTDATGATRDLEELAFAVNLDPRGSDLTPAPPTALPVSGTGAGSGPAPGHRRVELWHAVAAGLLVLLLLESALVVRRA